jgi:peroxiredoxin
VAEELKRRGGHLIAISVDPPEVARAVVKRNRLSFPVLCDTRREVIRALGLLHPGGGPGGADIPIPAHLLLAGDGRIVWRRAASRNQDRPDPEAVLAVIRRL